MKITKSYYLIEMHRITRRSFARGIGVTGACGMSYLYGAYNLTPLDFPEMIARSNRLAVTVCDSF